MAAGESQILFVLAWLVTIKVLQLGAWPALDRTFGRLAPAIAYPASILIFAAASWYLGLVGLPVWLALLPFAALLGYGGYTGFYTRERLSAGARWDMVFLIPFLFMLEVRYINPTISYAEKFMDHAFIASIMHTPTVPPLDPWYAGGTLAMYYYFGYWIFGAFGLATGVPSPVTFNLVLPTVFGLAAVSLYALGHLIMERYRWLLLLPLFIPNPSAIYQMLIGSTWFDVLWQSTRTIPDTINEYPIFSMLWGDPHPHVIGIFNQVFLLLILVFALVKWEDLATKGRLVVCGLAAVSLGAMPGINTWDVLVYAPIVVIFGILIWWRSDRSLSGAKQSWMLLLAVPPLSIALYLPYYLQLQSAGVEGVGIVPTPSDPGAFLLVHGFFLAILFAYCARDIVKKPYILLVTVPFLATGYFAAAIAAVPLAYLLARRRLTVPERLAVIGLAIILITEIFYLKDNMGETYYRMNTIFKFYLPAWILMGTAGFAIIAGWLDKAGVMDRISERSARALPVLAVVLLLAAPFAINVDFGYGTHTLDGLAYLDSAHPGDAAAVAYLRSLEGDQRIVEAEGGDYTYCSRISSFTGIPTIIGMPFHEYMWRNDWPSVAERTDDVRAIYEEPSRTVELMRKYDATILYVGDPEREKYRVSLPAEGLIEIYNKQGVQIYRVTP